MARVLSPLRLRGARPHNQGLFIADRNINGENAQYTRQNNFGSRYGYECQEEHDYYPYWHPTPWKDIAVLTNGGAERCTAYAAESANVKPRHHCEPTNAEVSLEDKYKAWKHNNKAACEGDGHVWTETAANGAPAPECNSDTIFAESGTGVLQHSIALPVDECLDDADSCRCVLRIRLNQTSSDNPLLSNLAGSFADSKNNGKGMMALVAQSPYVDVDGFELALAINSNQVSRVFEDRSHTFVLKKRPASMTDRRIVNFNVRGKRGNYVQTYPALQYSFVPRRLRIQPGTAVHFQWTGFDNNPNNGGNNGEGVEGTDRSNICSIDSALSNECAASQAAPLDVELAKVGNDDCLSRSELAAEHNSNQNEIDEDAQNCAKLNAAPALFNKEPVVFESEGVFHIMSSRNNNPSNRFQKASITVSAAVDDGPLHKDGSVPSSNPTGSSGSASDCDTVTGSGEQTLLSKKLVLLLLCIVFE